MRTSVSLSLAILATGCNQLFGIAPTQPIDAKVYDVMVDASSQCPPIGTAPTFSDDFRQVVAQKCTDYGVRPTRALASCVAVYEGPPDSALVLAPGFDPIVSYHAPRLGPDGDIAIMIASPGGPTVFHRDAASWTAVGTLPDPSIGFTSEPTRGPDARLLARIPGGLEELAQDDSGTWTVIGPRTFATASVASLHLSPDGLRVVYVDENSLLAYADRPTVADEFTTHGTIQDVSFVGDAFMTEDCGRLYFATLDSIWIAQQD